MASAIVATNANFDRFPQTRLLRSETVYTISTLDYIKIALGVNCLAGAIVASGMGITMWSTIAGDSTAISC